MGFILKGRILAGSGVQKKPGMDNQITIDFINKHELLTGVTMGNNQRLVLDTFVSMMYGIGTTNGSDIMTVAKSINAVIYPLTPSSDTISILSGYEVDLISGLQLGSYSSGFIQADITPSGVIGSVSKFFNSGKSTSDYAINNLTTIVYSNDSSDLGTADFGAYGNANTLANSTYMYIRLANLNRVRSNNSTTIFNANLDGKGLYVSSRVGNNVTVTKNSSTLGVTAANSTTTSNNSMYFHALNTGTGMQGTVRKLSFYAFGLQGLTSNELSDLNEAIQYYQANIITGGRLN